MAQLKRYLIERVIPGVGGMSIVELCGAARASNRAIEQIGNAEIERMPVIPAGCEQRRHAKFHRAGDRNLPQPARQR